MGGCGSAEPVGGTPTQEHPHRWGECPTYDPVISGGHNHGLCSTCATRGHTGAAPGCHQPSHLVPGAGAICGAEEEGWINYAQGCLPAAGF